MANTKAHELYEKLKSTLNDEQAKILLALDDENYAEGFRDGIRQGIKDAMKALLDLD